MYMIRGGGALIQLVSIPVNYMFTSNPEVSYFAGGLTKKLLHPELYTTDVTKPFNPRKDDVKEFPKEKYCGEIVFRNTEPILKKYGDSRYSNEENHLVPFQVRAPSHPIPSLEDIATPVLAYNASS